MKILPVHSNLKDCIKLLYQCTCIWRTVLNFYTSAPATGRTVLNFSNSALTLEELYLNVQPMQNCTVLFFQCTSIGGTIYWTFLPVHQHWKDCTELVLQCRVWLHWTPSGHWLCTSPVKSKPVMPTLLQNHL